MINVNVVKNWNNFVLGLLVAILPWLGLPISWKLIIFSILGLFIALFSLAGIRAGRDSAPLYRADIEPPQA